MQPSIYLDHNATTALDPEVLEAMRPHWLAAGNPESRHAAGRASRRAWEGAKESVARILGADPSEVIFTSGGTEANNLAIFGLAGAEHDPGHVVSSPLEHPAIAEPIARLEAAGFAVDRPEVDAEGVADAGRMASTFRESTRLATLMLANNETGALQPVARLAELANARGLPVHTDAVQAVGRIPVDFRELGVATLAASAHKFHGPVGVGLLLVRNGVRLGSRLFGGGQQQGRRPGTVAVPLAVGLAKALELWQGEAESRRTRWVSLRDRLESALIAALGPEGVIRNGPKHDEARLPQTLNLGFPNLDGDGLLIQFDLAGIAASLGSACASGSTRPSPTLVAMRVPDDRLRSSVRFSLGAATTAEEIESAIPRILAVVERIRLAAEAETAI
ncbi:cysteine desulfurase family protein [Singulisphaera sp. PoT]|uniref:cysteine desulfurase family protein n=1 Tax=Singulisphaera sp. PoT TaxID=3411797 RepID=UPI003BF509AB